MKTLNELEAQFRAMALASGKVTLEDLEGPPRCRGGCGTEVAKVAAECPDCSLARRQREHQASIQAAVNDLPKGLQWVKFNDPRIPQYVKDIDALRSAAVVARGMRTKDASTLVTIAGQAGAGKTLTALCILRACIDFGFSCESDPIDRARAIGARFRGADLLTEQSKRISLGDNFVDLNVAYEASVLVLDEVGHIPDPLGILFPMVNQRLKRGRPTIFTTPHADSAALSAACGDAGIARRVFDDAVVIRVRKEVA